MQPAFFSNQLKITGRPILCFGDSNTWGYEPGSARQIKKADRWPTQLGRLIGKAVVQDGVCGRTATVEDTVGGRPTAEPALTRVLEAQGPFDTVFLMLGTNDLKAHLDQSADEIVSAMLIHASKAK
ncbi:GDSL-type esterase/lipase family protein [Hoeflea prorocentri]|uniref:GDSL-type esterase/lipase family protein n=1 Tax=Hoeflea prorocentri TaxID=1922333 RepID=A0A9X3UET1_9HYPH|nr:GDSL-type esterase/lipase family protein [Hoeflea prorocentri]MCY6379401.1 GDSL-type esterase/lipase family protein [Hoeflea prorocentri]MDA5397202.1 GDSL-type esterase/lipase family protein [Hoeflea prorocentri]